MVPLSREFTPDNWELFKVITIQCVENTDPEIFAAIPRNVFD